MTGNNLAGRKEWLALVALVVAPLLAAMDISVLYFALPSIAASLEPSSTQQLWMTDIYGFVLAGMLLTMGNLGDRIGRRRTLILGCTVFGLASLASSFATSPEMLIATRALQGFGGASLMPSALALIRDVFPDDKQRRTAVTIWSLAVSAGAGLGPVLSGVLLNWFWWGSIFLINVPVIAALLIAIPFLVPSSRPAEAHAAGFDLISALLSLFAVLGVIWGVKEIAINGLAAKPIGGIVLGIVLAGVFVYRQSRLAEPVIAPELFRTRGFLSVLTVSATGFFLVIGFGVFTTQFLMEVLGYSPLHAALWATASPLLAGSVVPVAMGLVDKVKPAYLMAGGFVLAAAGFGVLTTVTADTGVAPVVIGIVGIGVGTALLFALLTDLVIAIAPAAQTGSVSALAKTFQEFGGALGLAIFGMIGTAVYRHYLDLEVSSAVPASAVQAARQTMGGATEAASKLPSGTGAELLNSARDAFAHAVSVDALVGIVVALASAGLLVFRLGHVSYTPEEAEEARDLIVPDVSPARESV